MIRSAVRRAAEFALGGVVADRLIRTHRGQDLLVLALHNVVPDDAPQAGDRSLHLRLGTFRGLLERLLKVGAPVSLDGTDMLGQGPWFAVTFDDAYRGATTLALPELSQLGVPSTVFVPTALMGDHTFWWDELADPHEGLDPELRRVALDELRGHGPSIRAWAAKHGRTARELGPLWRSASVEELSAAARLPGVALAAHSATHRALDRLERVELEEELLSSIAWFEAMRLPFRRLLAYPYGRCSTTVMAAAAAAGYEKAWIVSGGWTPSRERGNFALPRLNVPGGASVRGAMLRAADLL